MLLSVDKVAKMAQFLAFGPRHLCVFICESIGHPLNGQPPLAYVQELANETRRRGGHAVLDDGQEAKQSFWRFRRTLSVHRVILPQKAANVEASQRAIT